MSRSRKPKSHWKRNLGIGLGVAAGAYALRNHRKLSLLNKKITAHIRKQVKRTPMPALSKTFYSKK